MSDGYPRYAAGIRSGKTPSASCEKEKITILLPLEVAEQLRRHCANTGSRMSPYVAELVAAHFRRKMIRERSRISQPTVALPT